MYVKMYFLKMMTIAVSSAGLQAQVGRAQSSRYGRKVR